MGQVIERREAVQADARFVRAQLRLARARGRAKELMTGSAAQGTTEYAILVGVLVVIAILAIVAFRDKVSELWDEISSAVNSL